MHDIYSLVTCVIDANMFRSTAGNNNTATTVSTTSGIVVYDNIVPNVTIRLAAGQLDPVGGWLAQTISFDVVFSENVTGFEWGGVITSASKPDALTIIQSGVVTGAGANYVIVIFAQASGSINLTIRAGAAIDDASNGNIVSAPIGITVDLHATVVTIARAATQFYLASDVAGPYIIFVATFDTEVYGFNATGVILTTNTSATDVSVTSWGDLRTYNITVTGQTTYGAVQVDIPAGVCYDRYGNLNAVATIIGNIVVYDPRPTTVTVNQAPGQMDPCSSVPLRYNATFSRPVDGFGVEDVLVAGGTGSVNITQIDSFTYEIDIWPYTTQSVYPFICD